MSSDGIGTVLWVSGDLHGVSTQTFDVIASAFRFDINETAWLQVSAIQQFSRR